MKQKKGASRVREEDRIPLPIIHVRWRDAWTSTAKWSERELQEEGPLILDSVGFLVVKNTKGITIAGERGKDGGNRNVQHIPKVMVVSSRIIKQGN